MTSSRAIVLALLAASWAATAAQSQVLRVEGSREDRAVRIARSVAERSQYLIIDRDTLFPSTFHHPADLVIRDAEVRLEGQVEGDVVVLGGALYIRPGARIGGRIATIRGLSLSSRLAEVGEVVELSPTRAVLFQLRRDTVVVTVVPHPRMAAVSLLGVRGVRRLSYDRVDGVSASWGAEWRMARRENGARLGAWGTVRTARGRPGGGAELRIPLGAGIETSASIERATSTADEWIRSELNNSLSTLVGGLDVRDYHESDRVFLTLSRTPTQPLIQGEIGVEPYLSFVASRDRSLAGHAPWSVSGREQIGRSNPAIADSLIRSAEVGTRLRWAGVSSDIALQLSLEHAPEAWGDLPFSRWSADAGYRTRGLWHDRFEVRAHVRGMLGDRPAPPQRWTHVGGAGTLPTLATAALRGDHLAFVNTSYLIPIQFLMLPIVGQPALRASFATGTAWVSGTDMPAWEQNLSLGIEVSFFQVMAYVDPRLSRPRPLIQLQLAIP